MKSARVLRPILFAIVAVGAMNCLPGEDLDTQAVPPDVSPDVSSPADDPSVPPTPEMSLPSDPTRSATLAWDAPTTNADGTALGDLAGYKIKYGTAPGSYPNVINVGNVQTYTVTDLATGTYYFAVTALDTSSNESAASTSVSKVVP